MILWKVVIPMQKERYHVDLVGFDVKNRKGALSMKKLFSLVLAMTMLMVSFSVAVSAQEVEPMILWGHKQLYKF